MIEVYADGICYLCSDLNEVFQVLHDNPNVRCIFDCLNPQDVKTTYHGLTEDVLAQLDDEWTQHAKNMCLKWGLTHWSPS